MKSILIKIIKNIKKILLYIFLKIKNKFVRQVSYKNSYIIGYSNLENDK